MKPIVEKVLKSGLIDRSMAELMEKYQLLPEGAAEQVKEATREQMAKVVAEVVELAEQDSIIKETRFDLERLRWPVSIKEIRGRPHDDPTLGPAGNKFIAGKLVGVIDRMGRYFFRIQDVREEWFVPGFTLQREGKSYNEVEEILEVQKLYIDDQPVAVQVTTREV